MQRLQNDWNYFKDGATQNSSENGKISFSTSMPLRPAPGVFKQTMRMYQKITVPVNIVEPFTVTESIFIFETFTELRVSLSSLLGQ